MANAEKLTLYCVRCHVFPGYYGLHANELSEENNRYFDKRLAINRAKFLVEVHSFDDPYMYRITVDKNDGLHIFDVKKDELAVIIEITEKRFVEVE